MTAEDKQWQTENDARKIESYAELCANAERYKAAHEHLEKKKSAVEVALKTAEANSAMNAIIRGKTS
jgi:hypothetical protein